MLQKVEITVDTTVLSNAIASAEALKDKEADYTAESWSNMQEKLTAAKNALTAKDQATVDAAAKALTDAMDALEPKTPEVQKEVYVLMNIPYADFYKADGGQVRILFHQRQNRRPELHWHRVLIM